MLLWTACDMQYLSGGDYDSDELMQAPQLPVLPFGRPSLASFSPARGQGLIVLKLADLDLAIQASARVIGVF